MPKRVVSIVFAFILSLSMLIPHPRAINAQNGLNPDAIRAAAKITGMNSLKTVALPPVDFSAYLNPGADSEKMLEVFGKALFWDMQVGSDGQACASCHFAAGADNRAKNQLNPGLRDVNPDTVHGNPRSAFASGYPQFGPNYTLTEADFPFCKLNDPSERNYIERVVSQDTNDVVSSQGVFTAQFSGVVPGQLKDEGIPLADPVFSVNGVNARFVEPRNTPTVINAAFNVENFWDGRAKSDFNGVSPLGPLDDNASILVNYFNVLSEAKISIANSSLASQAVGPVLSNAEMSYIGRTFPDVGKKMLAAKPLAFQHVSSTDSMLGQYAVTANPALGLTFNNYAELITAIFQPVYWNSDKVITLNQANRVIQSAGALVPQGSTSYSQMEANVIAFNQAERVINEAGFTAPQGVTTYNQMEANFSFFFGLAVQAYERLLVSDQTPFDAFMEGDNNALTSEQLKGLLVFINLGLPGQIANPLFAGVSVSYCAGCHAGPEFTEAAFTTINRKGRIEIQSVVELRAGLLTLNPAKQAFVDQGFSNLGVSPDSGDLGRGGVEMGKPLSWTREKLDFLPFATFPLPLAGELGEARPANNEDSLNGAFKVPGLRNVELTAPYMHNGGELTLGQVVEFYDRHGDFGNVNPSDIDPDLLEENLNSSDDALLANFMLALTDERVRDESTPFDHPQLFIPNGSAGDAQAIDQFNIVSDVKAAVDSMLELPAVGAAGRASQGLPPVKGFLGVSQAPAPPPPPGIPAPAIYQMQLNSGWNLMSTPVELDARFNTLAQMIDPNSIKNITVAYEWVNGHWREANSDYILHPLVPIYIKLAPDASMTADYIPSTALTAPPSMSLTAGWNLIGAAPHIQNGTFNPMSLGRTLITVAGPLGYQKVSFLRSPGMADPLDWEYLPGGDGMPDLSAFQGYWVFMQNPGTLFGFSMTP